MKLKIKYIEQLKKKSTFQHYVFKQVNERWSLNFLLIYAKNAKQWSEGILYPLFYREEDIADW